MNEEVMKIIYNWFIDLVAIIDAYKINKVEASKGLLYSQGAYDMVKSIMFMLLDNEELKNNRDIYKEGKIVINRSFDYLHNEVGIYKNDNQNLDF